MKKLSREEMKNVMGGKFLYASGHCTGSVGSWDMVPPTSTGSCQHDITLYCASGSGSCTYIQA